MLRRLIGAVQTPRHRVRRLEVGRRWRDAAFPGGLPTRPAPDVAVPDRPAVVRSGDGRTIWMNSRAMDSRLGLEQVINPPVDQDGAAENSSPRVGLPLTTAIDAYTRHPSYASYDEQRKGTLSPGMLADIVILSGDVLEGPPERLRDSVINVTIFDGKIAYRRIAQATDNLN